MGRQKFVQYIRMLYLGFIDLNQTVNIYLSGVFSHDLYQIGHGKIHDVMSPRQLKDDIWMQKIVTLEETSGKAIISFLVKEISKEFFSHFRVFGLGGVLHSVFE